MKWDLSKFTQVLCEELSKISVEKNNVHNEELNQCISPTEELKVDRSVFDSPDSKISLEIHDTQQFQISQKLYNVEDMQRSKLVIENLQ